MSLNRELLGRRYESREPYEVALVKVREFARALGDENPLYHDPAAARRAGYPHVIAPPTFAVVVAQAERLAMLRDPELGLDPARMLHTEQRFRYRRPIFAGDALLATAEIVDISVRGQHEVLAWRQELAAADGDVICTLDGSVFSRGTAPA